MLAAAREELSGKVEGRAAGAPSRSQMEFLVQYQELPDEDARPFNGVRARVMRRHNKTGTAVVRMTAREALLLADDPNVLSISPDREVRASGQIDYSLATVGGVKAQSLGYDGRGIGMAIIDSGVAEASCDLQNGACDKSRVVHKENFAAWDPNGWDPYGHGAHVAGIAAGNGVCAAKAAGVRYQGMPGAAPGADIISLRALFRHERDLGRRRRLGHESFAGLQRRLGNPPSPPRLGASSKA